MVKPLWSRNVGTLDGNASLFKGFFTSCAIFLAISAYKNREEHVKLVEGAIKEEKTVKTK